MPSTLHNLSAWPWCHRRQLMPCHWHIPYHLSGGPAAVPITPNCYLKEWVQTVWWMSVIMVKNMFSPLVNGSTCSPTTYMWHLPSTSICQPDEKVAKYWLVPLHHHPSATSRFSNVQVVWLLSFSGFAGAKANWMQMRCTLQKIKWS